MPGGKDHFDFLPTTPGTQVSFTMRTRKRPCWRCRFLPERIWRRHWGCRPVGVLTYIYNKQAG